MKWIEFLLILGGVLLNAGAQLLLKAGMRTIGIFAFSLENLMPIAWKVGTNGFIVSGLSCYVISVVIWMMALSRVEVSLAYPMLSIGYVVNALLAYWLFGEALSPLRLAGIAVILLGVWLITRS